MEKPITLKIEELKKDLVGVINESQLPAFILDFVLKDVYTEIHLVNQAQLDNDKKLYEESLFKPDIKNKKDEDVE